MSYLTGYTCSECNKKYSGDQLNTYCETCFAPLLAEYDLNQLKTNLDREQVQARERGIWKWRELLPVFESSNILSLGEGSTPILQLSHISQELGLRSLFLKDEGVNPTGTFKARGLSVATSKAKELGINKFIIPTAGNAGGALAAYAARGSIDALIVMPRDTPQATISEIQAYGAQIRFVQGFIDEAARVSLDLARSEGWFDFSTFKEPNRLEGKKTLGYELAEFFDWRMPDVIIYPAGGGTGLVGMWKAIQEIFALGWFDHPTIPKFVLVQPDGCAPLVRAFDNGDFESQTWSNPKTIASGLRVPKSFADRLILRIVRESQGTAIAVNEKEILDAQRDLAIKEGIFAAPEGAATLAGLIRLFDMGWFKPDERIVIFNTGSGLKYI